MYLQSVYHVYIYLNKCSVPIGNVTRNIMALSFGDAIFSFHRLQLHAKIRENKTSSFGRDCFRNTIAKIALFRNLPHALNESYCTNKYMKKQTNKHYIHIHSTQRMRHQCLLWVPIMYNILCLFSVSMKYNHEPKNFSNFSPLSRNTT